jgi:hypothetical protein
MTDTNGDGTIDTDDCDTEEEPLTIIGPTTPSSVAEETPVVLSVDLQRAPADVRDTEVQGAQLNNPPAPAGAVAPAALARTGAADSTQTSLVLAGFLLALGTALVRLGRRPATTR